ncbi:hypothetical protein Taro_002025 [Colocasia esculenta]|uniref:Retrotransposon gag domain-containing protein n=1 Tax=Colocasia esculenta TaxID=4460 RepID=A0A843THP2_COLES|nr:hypothetical protein [Colocasia esculenta]
MRFSSCPGSPHSPILQSSVCVLHRQELGGKIPIRQDPQMAADDERADVWWASLLRTRFEDGAIDVAWDEFVRLFQAKFVPEHIQDRMEQEFLSLTQGSMTVLE